jgi:hypothetical protein
MALKYVQCQPFTVYGSGSTVGDTSLTLTTMNDIDGVALAMSDFGAKGYGTIEPGNGTQEEPITFTGLTVNGNSTVTLSGVKTQLTKSPYTETSGLAKSHAGGVRFVISNTAGFMSTFVNKANDETVTGTQTFTQTAMPRVDADHAYVAGEEKYLATYKLVQDTSYAGTVDGSTTAKGIFEEATTAETVAGTTTGGTGARLVVNPAGLLAALGQTPITTGTYGETISVGESLYFDTADSKWKKADASSVNTSFTSFGIALDAGVLNDAGKRIQVGGVNSSLSGLTVGYVYVSDTAGALSATPGTWKKTLGYAFNATTMLLMPTLDVAAINGTNATSTTDNYNEAMAFFNATGITGAEAESLTDGGTTELHHHYYKAGVITSVTATSTGNTDTTVTTNFVPKLIRLHYYIQGKGPATGYSSITARKGIAVYDSTGTLMFDNNIYDAPDLSGGGMNADDGYLLQINYNFNSRPDNATPPTTGSTNTGSSGSQTILSVETVTATSFKIRMAATSGGSTCRLRCAYEVHG